MSECCKNCIYISLNRCTNDYFKDIERKELLIIEDAENSKCEFYEDCR